MSRTVTDIEDIILELKSYRDARDKAIESLAGRFDNSDNKISERIRSLKHDREIDNDVSLCVSCRIIKDVNNNIVGMAHTTYYIDDYVTIDDTIPGLRTILYDENKVIAVEDYINNV